MTETQLGELLERATADLTPAPDLVTGAVRRGRSRRGRHLAATGVAAAAVLGAVTVGASLLPGGTGPATVADPNGAVSTGDPGFATGGGPATEAPLSQPATPDRPITVAGKDVPATIASFLPPGDVGPILDDDIHPFVTASEPGGFERTVHFRYNGALVTFTIERADARATPEEFANPPIDTRPKSGDGAEQPKQPRQEPGYLQVVDGLQVWVSPTYPTLALQVNGVSVWNHGYVVGLVSYNAPDGKNPDGSENVTPLYDAPVIDTETLIKIATSEVWFR
jgi:hypothetical protein